MVVQRLKSFRFNFFEVPCHGNFLISPYGFVCFTTHMLAKRYTKQPGMTKWSMIFDSLAESHEKREYRVWDYINHRIVK